jgi:hypothetical protein
LLVAETEEQQRPFRIAQIHQVFVRDLVAEWIPARRALIDAMRADVSPDPAPIEWPPMEAFLLAESEDEDQEGHEDHDPSSEEDHDPSSELAE